MMGIVWDDLEGTAGPSDQRARRHRTEKRSTCKQHAGVERGVEVTMLGRANPGKAC